MNALNEEFPNIAVLPDVNPAPKRRMAFAEDKTSLHQETLRRAVETLPASWLTLLNQVHAEFRVDSSLKKKMESGKVEERKFIHISSHLIDDALRKKDSTLLAETVKEEAVHVIITAISTLTNFYYPQSSGFEEFANLFYGGYDFPANERGEAYKTLARWNALHDKGPIDYYYGHLFWSEELLSDAISLRDALAKAHKPHSGHALCARNVRRLQQECGDPYANPWIRLLVDKAEDFLAGVEYVAEQLQSGCPQIDIADWKCDAETYRQMTDAVRWERLSEKYGLDGRHSELLLKEEEHQDVSRF